MKSKARTIKARAARIRQIGFIVLCLNFLTVPLALILFHVAFPDVAQDWSFSPNEAALYLSMIIAFLSTAHIGRGYALEHRERTRKDPDLSRTAAIIQLVLLMLAWTVFSILAVIITVFASVAMTWAIIGS